MCKLILWMMETTTFSRLLVILSSGSETWVYLLCGNPFLSPHFLSYHIGGISRLHLKAKKNSVTSNFECVCPHYHSSHMYMSVISYCFAYDPRTVFLTDFSFTFSHAFLYVCNSSTLNGLFSTVFWIV